MEKQRKKTELVLDGEGQVTFRNTDKGFEVERFQQDMMSETLGSVQKIKLLNWLLEDYLFEKENNKTQIEQTSNPQEKLLCPICGKDIDSSLNKTITNETEEEQDAKLFAQADWSTHNVLFSERMSIAAQVKKIMDRNNIATNVFGVVCALSTIGALKSPDISEKTEDEQPQWRCGQTVQYQGETHTVTDIDYGYGILALGGDMYICPGDPQNRCIEAPMSECNPNTKEGNR